MGRLGRSLIALVNTITDLEERDSGFESPTENIETSGVVGKSTFHVLAEFDRNVIREHTHATRARGRFGGRQRKLGYQQKNQIKILLNDLYITVSEISQRYCVSRTIIYRDLMATGPMRIASTDTVGSKNKSHD